MRIIKLLIIILVLLAGVLTFWKRGVLGAAQIKVQGQAEVINTANYLNFDESSYNSNVTIDNLTGIFFGYVWSEDLGWVDFGEHSHGGPVQVDLDSGNLSGKAYVINTGGLIDFDGHSSNVIIDLDTGDFSGYGWSEGKGWISFSLTRTSEPLNSSSIAQTGSDIRKAVLIGVVIVVFSFIIFRPLVISKFRSMKDLFKKLF